MWVKMNKYIIRSSEKSIREDLSKKMIFIGGPRQCGKTTLALHLAGLTQANKGHSYLNWDISSDRENILNENFKPGTGILILDEIHKYSRWRQIVKGLFDGRGHELKIIVTGSSRLDLFKKGGDSLQGRYRYHRLLPFTLSEIRGEHHKALIDLLIFGGFPEPFLAQSEIESKRWSREYRSRVIQYDLRDTENIQEIGIIERMSIRLPDLVGSPLSINSIREDLQVSHQSVTRWLTMFENIYYVFRIYPFGPPKIRAVKKESKHYHFDWTLVEEKGARFENMVACHLLKWCWMTQDNEGRDTEIRFFRETTGREIDFVMLEKGIPLAFIECKTSDRSPSSVLVRLKNLYPKTDAWQITLENGKDIITKDGIRVCPAQAFLSTLP